MTRSLFAFGFVFIAILLVQETRAFWPFPNQVNTKMQSLNHHQRVHQQQNTHAHTHDHHLRMARALSNGGNDPPQSLSLDNCVDEQNHAKEFCHAHPEKCPVKDTLIQILDQQKFNELNVTFVFPEIPLTRLDHCTAIPNRGERVRCVDEELRMYSVETQKQVVDQLTAMPQGWFDYYQNFSIMNRLVIKMVRHEDVVWRTALAPTVKELYEEQLLPISPDSCDVNHPQTAAADAPVSTATIAVATEAFEELAAAEHAAEDHGDHHPRAESPSQSPVFENSHSNRVAEKAMT